MEFGKKRPGTASPIGTPIGTDRRSSSRTCLAGETVMAEQLVAYVMWNGKWDKKDGQYVYDAEPGKDIMAKTINIVKGSSLDGLMQFIAGKMAADYNPSNTMSLHHRFPDPSMFIFPPALIGDDSDVDGLFAVYVSQPGARPPVVPMYVSVTVSQPDQLGSQYVTKLVPRRAITDGRVSPTFSRGLEDIDDGLDSNEPNADNTPPGQDEYTPYTGPSYSGAGTSSHDETFYSGEGQGPTAYWPRVELNLPLCTVDEGITPCNTRPDGTDFNTGDMFTSKDELKRKLNVAARDNRWQFKVRRSDLTRFTVGCSDESCMWYLGAYKKLEEIYFTIRSYNGVHTCTAMAMDMRHKNVTRSIVAHSMIGQFQNVTKLPSKTEVQTHVREAMKGGTISDWKAYDIIKKGKLIVTGTRHENYADLESFFYLAAQLNPGTVYEVETDDDDVFKYCYFMLGAQIHGITRMRPLVVLDCAWMKDEPGQLVILTMVDSEEECYPIAWGILDVECIDAYKWFLTKVQEKLPDRKDLIFISDRHQAIESAIKQVYPLAHHGVCWYHLWGNLKQLYPNGDWFSYYKGAGYANNQDKCKGFLNELDRLYPHKNPSNNVTISDYLFDKVGLERWTRSFSPVPRFDVMTSNHVESLNAMMNNARKELPIPVFYNVIETMSAWFYECRSKGAKMGTTLTTKREVIMQNNYDMAIRYKADHITDVLFNVKGDPEGAQLVDFANNTCACGEFTTQWLPCAHACACAAELKVMFPDLQEADMKVMYGFTSVFYQTKLYREAYSREILPVPCRHSWDRSRIPEHIKERVVLPPPQAPKKKGRMKEKRFPSVGEAGRYKNARKYRCDKCKEKGHNKATCPNVP